MYAIDAPAMNSLSYRDALPEDAHSIARLLIETKEISLPQTITEHDRDFDFWRDRWVRYIRDGSTAQMARGDGCVILAECAGDLVAFAAYHHTTRFDCHAELQSMYVLPSHQNRGIGRELLRLIVNRLQADGSQSLCVGYSPQNPYRRFYLKHGAVEINPHWAAWRPLRQIGSSTD